MADRGRKNNNRTVNDNKRVKAWKLEALTEVDVFKAASFLELKNH